MNLKLKIMYISCEFHSYKDLEESGAHFSTEVYTSRSNVGERGEVYIIPKDNESYIFPATLVKSLPKGDVFEATVLCSAYSIGSTEVRREKVFGVLADCVDDGGNNYLVSLRLKNNIPLEVTLPTNQ